MLEVADVATGSAHDLDFSDSVTNFAAGYGKLLVATSAQVKVRLFFSFFHPSHIDALLTPFLAVALMQQMFLCLRTIEACSLPLAHSGACVCQPRLGCAQVFPLGRAFGAAAAAASVDVGDLLLSFALAPRVFCMLFANAGPQVRWHTAALHLDAPCVDGLHQQVVSTDSELAVSKCEVTNVPASCC